MEKETGKFTLLRNIKILENGNFTKANLIISNPSGRIIRIFKSTLSNRFFVKRANRIYEGEGCWALPGVIDAHVHFREPGEEYKEDFESGSAAAVAGGVTFVGDMPNNQPLINTPKRLQKKAQTIDSKSFVNYALYMGAPAKPKQVTEALNSTVKPLGIKIYYYKERDKQLMHSSSLSKKPLYIIHPEHPDFIREKEYETYEEFEKTRPVKAEVESIRELLNKAREGYKIHFTHITSKKSLELIKKGKRENLPISADVTPHHLLLDKENVQNCQNAAKCYPPLRSRTDRKTLFEDLLERKIDMIASDHAPHHPKEKRKEIIDAPAGISGIEFMLPLILTLTRTYRKKRIQTVVKALSTKPARLLGLKARGEIKLGNFADIVLFDPTVEWKIQGENTFSKGKITPYEGMKVKGKVKSTLVNGELVYHNNHLRKKVGRLLTPPSNSRVV